MAGTAAGHHQPRRRDPDLVLDSKMETSKHDNGNGDIQHTSRGPPITPGELFSEVKQTWYRKSTIVPSRIFLEECPHTPERRAVKVLDAHPDNVRELEALAKFSRPKYAHCFVKSDGWFELDNGIAISMEYLHLGHLGRHLANPLPELEVRDIVEQLLEGLKYMHEAGFVHRNLTPENIMVAATNPRWIVKIGGFGCVIRDAVDVSMVSSRNRLSEKYSAPELLGLTEPHSDFTYAVDMWSLGAITFRLLTNATPFNDEQSSNHPGGYLKRSHGDLRMGKLDEERVSESAQDFIVALMERYARHRPSADEAADHQWFKIMLSAERIRGQVNTPPQTPRPARATTSRRPHTPPQPSTPPRPGLYRRTSSKRKSSQEPDEHPPPLQKRPSLKTTDVDDFATSMGIAGSSIAPKPSAADRHGGYETCSETLVSNNSPPRRGPLDELWAIQTRFNTEVLPQCVALLSLPATDFLDKTQRSLVEALERLQMDVDGVHRGEDEAARVLGKQLVRAVQDQLAKLDEAFKSGGWRRWDCPACKRKVRFGKGTREGTYEVYSGDETNMVVVNNPSYNCQCGQDYLCLSCGLVQARSCKCYMKSGKRRGGGRA
ncbi:hypothetical protein PspLS_01527 [Pyricularia sp. CBS 133598]|nr:hypothetical protein PspLS_01527 [Pyricularia sp. CBS 133598]